MSNVKAGDLAIVVNAAITTEMIGHIVTVVRQAVQNDKTPWGGDIRFTGNGITCICESASGSIPWRTTGGRLLNVQWRAIHDGCLKPLRDNPGEDETLQWAGHPKTAEIRKGVEMLEKAVDRLQRMADELQKGRV